MSLTNADLLAISNLLDKKIDPLEARIGNLENRFDGLENRFDGLEKRFDSLEKEVKAISVQIDHDIIPRLSTIEDCYLSTYERYMQTTEKIERYMEKQDLLTVIVMEHEQKLKKLGM